MDNNPEIKLSTIAPTFSVRNWYKPSPKIVIALSTATQSLGYLILLLALLPAIPGLVGLWKASAIWAFIGGTTIIGANVVEKMTKGEPVSVMKSMLPDIKIMPNGIIQETNGTEQTDNRPTDDGVVG